MDPARTFAQYPQYGFGKGRAQKLKIVEASEHYKRSNLRYKQFDKDNKTKGPVDIDEDNRCFGWAKYVHKTDCLPDKADGKADVSVEWRPVYALPLPVPPPNPNAQAGQPEKPIDYKDKKVDTGSHFMVQMLHAVSDKQPDDIAATDKAVRQHLGVPEDAPPDKKAAKNAAPESKPAPNGQLYYYQPKQEVMLRPRTPLMASPDPAFMDLLEGQAKMLRQFGKSDFEIATSLQKSLQDSQGNTDGSSTANTKKGITVDVVRSYFVWKDAKEAKDAEQKRIAAQATKK